MNVYLILRVAALLFALTSLGVKIHDRTYSLSEALVWMAWLLINVATLVRRPEDR